MQDAHFQLTTAETYAHMAEYHSRLDIDGMIAAVTAEQLAEYRSRVADTGTDTETRWEIVHEQLHAKFGDGHPFHFVSDRVYLYANRDYVGTITAFTPDISRPFRVTWDGGPASWHTEDEIGITIR